MLGSEYEIAFTPIKDLFHSDLQLQPAETSSHQINYSPSSFNKTIAVSSIFSQFFGSLKHISKFACPSVSQV